MKTTEDGTPYARPQVYVSTVGPLTRDEASAVAAEATSLTGDTSDCVNCRGGYDEACLALVWWRRFGTLANGPQCLRLKHKVDVALSPVAYVAGAVLDALWEQFGEDGLSPEEADAEYEQWKTVAVAAVEALPVAGDSE